MGRVEPGAVGTTRLGARRHGQPPSHWPQVCACSWLTLAVVYFTTYDPVHINGTPLSGGSEGIWITFWVTCVIAQVVMLLPASVWAGRTASRIAGAVLLVWASVGTSIGACSLLLNSFRGDQWVEPFWLDEAFALWFRAVYVVGWLLFAVILVGVLCLGPAWMTFRNIRHWKEVLRCAATPAG